MDESKHRLDPHRRPPLSIKALYKKYQRANCTTIDSDQEILDLRNLDHGHSGAQSSELRIIDHIRSEELETACANFGSYGVSQHHLQNEDLPCYESQTVPGTYYLAYSLLHFLTGQGFS